MATPRRVRLQKRLGHALRQLFTDFPDLQWFRNIHDRQVHIAQTCAYMAVWSDKDGSSNMDHLTTGRNGPVIYYGRDLHSKPWAFASNIVKSDDVSVTWLVSVEKPDTYMVAVLNTLLSMEGLMPAEETTLFLSSLGLSNSEEPSREVIDWLMSHMDKMPVRLQNSCYRARLYRR